MNQRNFFAELKRRNVYKVAVAYAVVGWLVIAPISMVDFTGEFRFKWYDHVDRTYESK